MSIEGGKPGTGFTYETAAGDVCGTCGAVIAAKKKHSPCPITTLTTALTSITTKLQAVQQALGETP